MALSSLITPIFSFLILLRLIYPQWKRARASKTKNEFTTKQCTALDSLSWNALAIKLIIEHLFLMVFTFLLYY